MSRLYVVRPPSSLAGSLRNYRIILDRSEVGRIAAGTELAFDISAGRHAISAMLDWSESNTVWFEVGLDDEYSVEVCPNGETVREFYRNLRKSGHWLRVNPISVDDAPS